MTGLTGAGLCGYLAWGEQLVQLVVHVSCVGSVLGKNRVGFPWFVELLVFLGLCS
jgi:hypothetical protein